MNTKYLYKALLLSSALLVTGCGGGNGDGSNSNSTNQAELNKTQSDLKSIQDQANQVLIQLTQTNQDVIAKKQTLDALQAKLAVGDVTPNEMAAAQAAYNQASAELASQEQKKADLADKARKVKEKADTLTAVVKLDSTLNNIGPAVLSGTFSKADFDTFVNAVHTKPAAQLVRPFNKFIEDMKSGLDSGAKIRAAFPKLLNSPIVDALLIPLVANQISAPTQKQLELSVAIIPNYFTTTVYTPIFNVEVNYNKNGDSYILQLPIKDAIEQSTAWLLQDFEYAEHEKMLAFLDDYLTNNPKLFNDISIQTFKAGDPKVLQAGIQQLLVKLKPVAIDFLGKMPDKWVNWFAEMIQDIPSDVDAEDMTEFKKQMAYLASMLTLQGLSAEEPVSTSGNTAYRKARSVVGGVGLNQLAIDGQTLDQSYVLDMPLRVDLKGSLTSSKTADIIGSVTYNMNGTVIGMVQSIGNMVGTHSESSLLVSQSIGNFFIEGQAGFVGVRDGLFSGWEGQRYQATLGYDAAYVSPFVQFEYRPLTNGFTTLDAVGAYVGLESDVLKVQLADAVFTSTVLAKVGYESATETLFTGQSLQSNKGGAAFVEWNGGLKLSSGLEVKSALTLGSKQNTVKLNIAFEQ